MPEIDLEIIARAMRWCAESGRPAREEEVRATLGPLSWDELLAVKATLADPPPARDLGPDGLLALARGGVPAPSPAPAPRAPRPPRAAGARSGPAAGAPRIRRARDRVEAGAPGPVALPPVELLLEESGRAVLERLVRRRGASRAALLQALGAGWTSGGQPPGDPILDRLLDHHGLSRAFAERERALVLHAFRKQGGVFPRVARDLETTVEGLRETVARLGITRQVETVRGERRRALEARATISERARLLDEQEEELADLGILSRFEDDLRRRMPGQLRALSVGGRRPSAVDLGRSLSLPRPAVDRLATRLGLELRQSFSGEDGAEPRAGSRPGSRSGPRPGSRSGPRPGPRPDSRSGPRPGQRSGPPSGPRPGFRPGPRSGPRDGSRPGPRSGPGGSSRPAPRPGTRSAPRPGPGGASRTGERAPSGPRPPRRPDAGRRRTP